MKLATTLLITAALAAGAARAGELKVLSAGAVEPGLAALSPGFMAKTHDSVHVEYATAPRLRARLAAGERPDIVIAPPAVLDEVGEAAKLDRAGRVAVGKVGVGVAVRRDAQVPEIGSADALKRAILEADRVLYNEASTGIYVEKLLERLGVAEEAKPKTVRLPDGTAVMERLLKGSGREIGFGAVTEILLYRRDGLKLVGPLPAEIQNFTSYAAAASTEGPNPEAARAFLELLATEPAKAVLQRHGIE